jgi:signal recognition particle GTPase
MGEIIQLFPSTKNNESLIKGEDNGELNSQDSAVPKKRSAVTGGGETISFKEIKQKRLDKIKSEIFTFLRGSDVGVFETEEMILAISKVVVKLYNENELQKLQELFELLKQMTVSYNLIGVIPTRHDDVGMSDKNDKLTSKQRWIAGIQELEQIIEDNLEILERNYSS